MPPGKRINNLILADEHQLFRRGLRSLMTGQEGLRVTGEASNGKELMAALESPVDFAVIDVSVLAQLEDSELQWLRHRLSGTPSLFLSKEDRPECLEFAMKAGGRAYMLKSTPASALIAAIQRVASGDDMHEFATTSDLQALAESGRRASRPDVLTSREQEILRLLAEGRTVRETASELALSAKTVEAHKLNLMRKLRIHDRATLIEYAIQNGYIPAPIPA